LNIDLKFGLQLF